MTPPFGIIKEKSTCLDPGKGILSTHSDKEYTPTTCDAMCIASSLCMSFKVGRRDEADVGKCILYNKEC